MEVGAAFQDLIPNNQCWGCGPTNSHGLKIKSYWEGEEAICRFKPNPEHMAGPPNVLNGGIIATLIDCHGVCTAIAGAYKAEGRDMDAQPPIWYVTGTLEVKYLKPVPLPSEVLLKARILEMKGKKSLVSCELWTGNEIKAQGELVAIRTPEGWGSH